jgi:Ni/Co efflux regulator RcnB
MVSILKALIVAGLLAGTSLTPALAQRRTVHSQATNSHHYREVSVTRGHKWRKGQRLAANQRRYVVPDWKARGLRTPPRGYQWVRENNNSGDYLLVSTITGLISSILSQ